MRTISITALSLVLAVGSAAVAQQAQLASDPARVDAAVKAAFPTAPADWQGRLAPDATMKECSAYHNNPPKAVADAIQKRELVTVKYPADGKFIGDWKKGEALAQSGYGLRFSDYPPRRANGGNCYACHQLTKKEVSYGTIGPSLLEYGKLRDYKPEAIKAVYERIYNSQTAFACSNMPRFGANGILTIEQIKDAVALLMSPDSPVNKGQ
jgi:sulfur-oxidizing protein SoxX